MLPCSRSFWSPTLSMARPFFDHGSSPVLGMHQDGCWGHHLLLGEAMVLQDLQDLGHLLVDWQFAIHDAGDLINHMAWNCHAF